MSTTFSKKWEALPRVRSTSCLLGIRRGERDSAVLDPRRLFRVSPLQVGAVHTDKRVRSIGAAAH